MTPKLFFFSRAAQYNVNNDKKTSDETRVHDDVLADAVQNSLMDLKFGIESSEIESAPLALNPNQHKCSICNNGETFENQESLNQHLTQKHPDPNVSQNNLTSFLQRNENQGDDDVEKNSKKFKFTKFKAGTISVKVEKKEIRKKFRMFCLYISSFLYSRSSSITNLK